MRGLLLTVWLFVSLFFLLIPDPFIKLYLWGLWTLFVGVYDRETEKE